MYVYMYGVELLGYILFLQPRLRFFHSLARLLRFLVRFYGGLVMTGGSLSVGAGVIADGCYDVGRVSG